jgi:carboxyl-terminal processing protease
MEAMEKRKRIISFVVAIILVLAVFAGGAFFGYANRPAMEKVTSIFNKNTPQSPQIDFSPFWDAWNTVESKYVSSSTTDKQKMVWGAIEGMVSSLGDPYSSFFPPQENKQFNDEMRGNFGGVGMEISVKNGILVVVAPLKDTPAYRAGIKSGDKILKIDDKTTESMTAEQASLLIKGDIGTVVKLTVMHAKEDKSFELNITRDIIKIPVLDTEKKGDGIFVIRLYNFSENSANEFRNALRQFVESGDNKLVLDLRGNPGGYLESAIDIASWFLPMGKTVAREKFSNGEENIFRSRGYAVVDNLPFVILVDGGSASASEILAGALKESGVAKLVGTKTFGKGSVQELFSITSDTSLKLTIAKWLTPNGVSISDQGLEPDYKIEITEKDIESNRDPQMEKTLEILKNWK